MYVAELFWDFTKYLHCDGLGRNSPVSRWEYLIYEASDWTKTREIFNVDVIDKRSVWYVFQLSIYYFDQI